MTGSLDSVEGGTISPRDHADGVANGINEARRLAQLLVTIDAVSPKTDPAQLCRNAIEAARNVIGLERVSLFLAERRASRVVLRGTWGTNEEGRTTDEHGFAHECHPGDYAELCQLHRRGALWKYQASLQHLTSSRGKMRVIGQGWVAITPLVSNGELVGVMYNDAALTRNPFDPDRQLQTAVFCSLLARAAAIQGTAEAPARPERKPTRPNLVRRTLMELEANPRISGDALAHRLLVSPGHLARSFKTAMGESLVDYRNRQRLARFARLMEHGCRNLLEAALEAGFGSYAQFHRVHRQMTGRSPKHAPVPHSERRGP
ncbi:MAG: AraC family transcriptional regulator [Polyangiaceae bacterium]